MTPEDRAAGLIRDLVTLMYRADWTTLSLAAEIAKFDDFSAYMRMVQPARPSWALPAGPHPPGRPGDRRDRRPGGAEANQGREDEDEADDDEDDGFEPSGSRREQSLRLLLAPGGRFRAETHSSRGRASVRVSDGQTEWGLDEGGRPGAPSVSAAVPPDQAPCAELLCPACTAVRVRPSRPDEDFRIEVPAGTRVVADTGTLLDEADAPAPVQAAAQLAGKAFKGAVRLGSFLESVRGQAGPPGPGDRG
jgi:hypothetical protein